MIARAIVASAMLVAGTLGATPAASDPMPSLRFLVGNWSCTYRAGKAGVTYAAVFSYDMGGNWLRERDSWRGGGSDEGLFTYDRRLRTWTAVIVENERSAVIFRGNGDPAHITYRSIYPDTTMSETFDRHSTNQYTLHFSRTAGGKTMKSVDVCVKR